MTDLCSGILQPRTVRNRSFTTLWRKAPGFWREHTASLALNPGMLQIMRFKIWHLYVQKSYHIMVLLALVLDNLHNSLMALWVMQLSEAYTYTPLVSTLTALYLLQIHAWTQISHIREKQEHFKVLFGDFCYVAKKQNNPCSACNVLRKTTWKRSPGERKKLLHRAPCTHHTKRNMTSKSFPVKHREKLRSWCCGTSNSFHLGFQSWGIILQSHFDHYCSLKRQRTKKQHLQT